MQKYTTIEKKVGETPLEALARVRERDSLLATIPLAYAGRLDPMASGTLLVLLRETCKQQSLYHALDKEYAFEILLGISSDTGDILGMSDKAVKIPHVSDAIVREKTPNLTGTIMLPYPPYSSKTVRGKPLFLWALENRLDEIEIPVATTQVYTLSYKGQTSVTSAELSEYVHARIALVTPVTDASKALGADFRRIPILAQWDSILRTAPEQEFQILRFTTTCSSGTYIRALAPHIASLLSTTGLAYSIHRTKIGRYRKIPFLKKGFWFPSY